MGGLPLTQTHGLPQPVPNNEAAMTHLARTLQQFLAQRHGIPWFKIARPVSLQVCQLLHYLLSKDWTVLSLRKGKGRVEDPARVSMSKGIPKRKGGIERR
jgi:hypothetical protein